MEKQTKFTIVGYNLNHEDKTFFTWNFGIEEVFFKDRIKDEINVKGINYSDANKSLMIDLDEYSLTEIIRESLRGNDHPIKCLRINNHSNTDQKIINPIKNKLANELRSKFPLYNEVTHCEHKLTFNEDNLCKLLNTRTISSVMQDRINAQNCEIDKNDKIIEKQNKEIEENNNKIIELKDEYDKKNKVLKDDYKATKHYYDKQINDLKNECSKEHNDAVEKIKNYRKQTESFRLECEKEKKRAEYELQAKKNECDAEYKSFISARERDKEIWLAKKRLEACNDLAAFKSDIDRQKEEYRIKKRQECKDEVAKMYSDELKEYEELKNKKINLISECASIDRMRIIKKEDNDKLKFLLTLIKTHSLDLSEIINDIKNKYNIK